MRTSLISAALISFFFFFTNSASAQMIISDSTKTPGLRKVEQQDGTQIFFLYNPNMMDKMSVKKATQDLKEEIKFLEGQKEMMKKCGDCFEELVNEIDHNEKLLAELTKKKINNFIKLPFKK